VKLFLSLWVLVALTAAAPKAYSQGSPLDFQRVAPKAPPRADRPASLPSPETEDPEDDTPVLDRLVGIVLLDQPQEVRRQGWPRYAGIKSEGDGLLANPGLVSRLTPFLGKATTFGDLQLLCAEVVKFYRENNRPVVDAQLPEQEITTGVVQVLVIEGRAGRVLAEEQRWFPEQRLIRAIRVKPGDFIEANRLLDDINWLNRNSFRRTDLLFRKGEVPGETDIVLKTTDRLPFRPYVSYDDWGTDLTGTHRLQAGFNWGNAFGLDQTLSYQFSTAPNPEVFTAHAGIWTIPLPWRHVLEFFGSYGRSRPEDLDVDVDAKSLQLGTLYTVPLPNIRGIKQDIALGAEFKESNNNLLFGGTSIFNSETQIFQLRLSYQAREVDVGGATSAQVSIFYSPGGITESNTDEAFEQERAFAEAEYFYGRVSIQRTQRLPKSFTLVASAAGQIATGNLLASEQFSLGGATTVRGYEEGILNGDRGWLASVELYSPPILILNRIGIRTNDDELKFLAFCDLGGASNVHLLPDEDSYVGIAGVGVGVRYRVGTWLSFRMDYAWQLQDIPDTESDSSRLYVSVTLSY
jgi:hemolysin activation/secretion protein